LKAILDRDIIIGWRDSGIEVGTPPSGVGLERLRWDGEQIVDLADLSTIHISRVNGVYELHCVAVSGSQPVYMGYVDRKNLISDGGVYRVLNASELLGKAKVEKKQDIKRLFDRDSLTLTTTSSLGFEIDAHRVAKDNVVSLIDITTTTIPFRATDNSFHNVTPSDLATMKIEIIAAAFGLYQKKWAKEAEIDAAETISAIGSVVW